MPRDFQGAFNAGELAPALHARADLTKFHTGLAECLNWFVLAQGGVRVRPGTYFIGPVADHGSVTRTIQFQFNTEQSYTLLFSDLKMHVIKDGGYVLETAVNVVNATQASPCNIEATGHGYTTGDLVYLSGLGGMTELNGRFAAITVIDPNNFTLDGIDSTGFTAYTSGGTVEKAYSIATPYVEADLFRLKYTQSADVMTITHPSYQQRNLSRTDHDAWSLTALAFASGVAAPTTGLGVTQVGTASGLPNKTYRYVVTSVDANGTESPASAVQSSGSINALSETYGNTISWSTVPGADYYNVYKESSLNSGIFGWIGEADEDGSPSFDDYNFGPDMSVTPPIATDPLDGTDDYPGCCTYHQQREWFGATNNQPTTLFGTRIADYDNMDVHRPLLSSDAIEATVASRQVNEIRHLVSLDNLMVLTSGGEWLAKADQDGILTPANINFRVQGYRGSSHTAPLTIGNTALYVQEKGSRVRDLGYKFENDAYVGNDLTVLSKHLFDGYTIDDWCYQQEPNSVVWAVRSDGTLLSLTYMREHDVWGWAQHTTDGEFESVCCISEGGEDVVYAVVKRTIEGSDVRYVEKFTTQLDVDNEDNFYVDSGLTYDAAQAIEGIAIAVDGKVTVTITGHGYSDGDIIQIDDIVAVAPAAGETNLADLLNGVKFEVADSTANDFVLKTYDGTATYVDATDHSAYSSSGWSRLCVTTISGLWHLEGEDVDVLSDGDYVPDLTVTNGEITMPNPGAKVHIGLSYTKRLRTLPIDFSGQPTQSRKKGISYFSIRTQQTRGLRIGRETTDMKEFKERTPDMNYDPVTPYTGVRSYQIKPSWDTDGQIYIDQPYPLPGTLLAVIPEVVLRG